MTTYHVCTSKDWIKREIQAQGPDAVLTEKGLTLEQAFAVIDAIPTTNIPATDCNNYNEHGVCQGHPSPVCASFLGDDEADDDDDAARLHIEADLDYWVSVGKDRYPSGTRVRVRTSGERDPRLTYLIAALYKLGLEDLSGARGAVQAFLAELGDDPNDHDDVHELDLPPGCTGPHPYGDGLFCIKDATGADYVWAAMHPVAAIRSAWAQFQRMHGATVYRRAKTARPDRLESVLGDATPEQIDKAMEALVGNKPEIEDPS
jgi:hypothetical protein